MAEIISGKTYAGRERLQKAREHIQAQIRKWQEALYLNNAEWHELDNPQLPIAVEPVKPEIWCGGSQ